MDYPQEHIKPYGNDGKKSEQVEEMFDNIAPRLRQAEPYPVDGHRPQLAQEGD